MGATLLNHLSRPNVHYQPAVVSPSVPSGTGRGTATMRFKRSRFTCPDPGLRLSLANSFPPFTHSR